MDRLESSSCTCHTVESRHPVADLGSGRTTRRIVRPERRRGRPRGTRKSRKVGRRAGAGTTLETGGRRPRVTPDCQDYFGGGRRDKGGRIRRRCLYSYFECVEGSETFLTKGVTLCRETSENALPVRKY